MSLFRLILISIEGRVMMQSDVLQVRRVRRWRSVSEKRQIVQSTMELGASVAEIARVYGLNANQLFKWRRVWEGGELRESYVGLLPVSVSSPVEPESKTSTAAMLEPVSDAGSIHIELHGRALISVERGADAEMVRCIFQSVGK